MFKKKLNMLSDAQAAQFPKYVNRWKNIGLSTALVNLNSAKKAICEAYRKAGLKVPTQFYVVDSPLSAIKKIMELDSNKTSRDIFNEMIYGCHDAAWLGVYQFYRDEVGIQDCNKLDDLIELAKHVGWLNVYENVVVFQHRPEVIKFDDEGRLHSADGPAIRYRDGFSIYSWHGVRIPSDWIENKDKLTTKIALTWSNIEQRRCAIEILGWNKIIETLNAKVIDDDGDPEIGTLIEVDIPEFGREKFLKVQCGTRRIFYIPVPPEMKTALEANSWTYGLEAKNFVIPEVRT